MAFNPDKCLKFEALENNCRIALGASKVDGSIYQFSKDGSSWIANAITLNSGETCYVKGTNFPSELNSFDEFSISAKAKIISGNVMSLADDGAGELVEVQSFGFARLFYQCSNLISIPESLLPAKTVGSNGYDTMFDQCTGLTELPAKLLPATALWANCYQNMFRSCQGLTSIPAGFLPARSLNWYCYRSMFQNCTNLTTIPSNLLPATTLTNRCYQEMFRYCTSLKSIPKGLLPAKRLGQYCYLYMFNGCSNLEEISVDFEAWNDALTSTGDWVSGVAEKGVFYCPVDLPQIFDISHIPPGWVVKHYGKPTVTVNFLNKHKIGGRIK